MTKSKILIGLTGSIGMGKSTTAAMFAEHGAVVWDADKAVSELYDRDGAAVAPIGKLFPSAIIDGAVDKGALKLEIAKDPDALRKIEAIVHPLVRKHRADFLNSATAQIIVFDIPLLFETGAQDWLDYVVVVSAPEHIQRQRVLARPGMTEMQLNQFLAKQMPDEEKRQKADFVIDTIDIETARREVEDILAKITERTANA